MVYVLRNSKDALVAYRWLKVQERLFPVDQFRDELLRSAMGQWPSVFEEALLCRLEPWEEWVEKMIEHNAQYLDWRLARLDREREIEEAMKGVEDKVQEIKEAMEGCEDKDRAPGPETDGGDEEAVEGIEDTDQAPEPETDGEGDEEAETLPN